MTDVRPAASSESTAVAGIPVIARIPYLNAEPFHADWPNVPGSSVRLVPRLLGEEARAGRVDAGLMAVADFFTLERDFERVGRLGIACRGEVESVLLLARGPIEALAGARIVLTSESSTSAALIRLLLEKHYGLEGIRFERAELPEICSSPLEATPPQGEAWLVIGDAALSARRRFPDAVALDLGSAWREWTGLPFVYAVWAVRRSLPDETRNALHDFLERSLGMGERDLERIAATASARTDGRLGSAGELTRYLQRFVFRIEAEEERGLAAFRSFLMEQAG